MANHCECCKRIQKARKERVTTEEIKDNKDDNIHKSEALKWKNKRTVTLV